MKGVAAATVALWGALFQIVQKPVIPPSDGQPSLEKTCNPVVASAGSTTMLPGVATLGGSRFNFESVRGSDCRDYVLWNEPGQQSVKFKWQYAGDKTDPLLAAARLARCNAASQCWAIHFPKFDGTLGDPRTTMLGYGGANADSQTEHPRAFVSDREDTTQAIRSVIQGTVGDADGQPVQIAVEVISAVVGKEPPYRLVYTIRVGEKVRPLSLWLPDRRMEKELTVRWESAESPEYMAALRKTDIVRLTYEKPIVNIEIAVRKFARSSKLLVVTQGDDRLAATNAAAYVPAP